MMHTAEWKRTRESAEDMIQINDLRKDYGAFSLELSMQIPKGRITGLVGKNGAGKSTVIKAIIGLIRPDGGMVNVLGKNSLSLTAKDKEHLGAVLADSGFSSVLTVRDVAVILKRFYSSFDSERFLQQCRKQGLPERKSIATFSSGMKATLRLLTALSHSADLLILDEPTSGLDVGARNAILDLLRDYVTEKEQRSILITSHIATDLESLCDDIYLIDQGRVLLHEDTDVILDQYGILKADDMQFSDLDRRYLKKIQKEDYGYRCLTNERSYYLENYPGLVIEKCGIDDIVLMLTEAS